MNYHFLSVTFLGGEANSMFPALLQFFQEELKFPQDWTNFPNRSQAIFVGEVPGADGCVITRYPLCLMAKSSS